MCGLRERRSATGVDPATTPMFVLLCGQRARSDYSGGGSNKKGSTVRPSVAMELLV